MKHTKQLICILLSLILVLALCACGGEKPAEAPAQTSAPRQQSTLPDAGLHQAEEAGAEELSDRIALAQSFLEKDAADLIAALGEPLERNYASSCIGPGEDGELVYDGFTVFTYKEGDSEIVKGVE